MAAKKLPTINKKKIIEAKELWLDMFSVALEAVLWDAGQGMTPATVDKAVEIANTALDKVEERWPE